MWLDEFLAAYILLFMTSVETHRSVFQYRENYSYKKVIKAPCCLKPV